MITSRDIRDQVLEVLDAAGGADSSDFDVDAIVTDLIAEYGLTLDHDEDAFWAIVERHAR